jgi:hypothetical protein
MRASAKIINYYANVPIRTPHRFVQQPARAPFRLRRHWDDTQRKIEDGTYDRHRFQAELHERERGVAAAEPKPVDRPAAPAGRNDLDQLYSAWIDARSATGQPTAGLTREKLAAQLEQQTKTIQERGGEVASAWWSRTAGPLKASAVGSGSPNRASPVTNRSASPTQR